jgi:alpha-tubulin suppressor-like RCC1 family protein
VLRTENELQKPKVTGDFRILYSLKLHDLSCSPNTVVILKARRMIWAGNEAHMGEMRNAYKVLFRKSEGEETTWEVSDADKRIIIR